MIDCLQSILENNLQYKIEWPFCIQRTDRRGANRKTDRKKPHERRREPTVCVCGLYKFTRHPPGPRGALVFLDIEDRIGNEAGAVYWDSRGKIFAQCLSVVWTGPAYSTPAM